METPLKTSQEILPEYHGPEQGVLFDYIDAEEHLNEQYSYKVLDSPELRTQYVWNTERLIGRVIAQEINDIVFLDKSARPVAWLMKSLWPLLGVDEDGRALAMPTVKFANIDREQWEPLVGRSEDKNGGINMNRIHPDTVDSLRGLYALKNLDRDDRADDEPTLFDGRKLMIIDEVKSSGDTIAMSEWLFEKAFPEAEIHTSYWMSPATKQLKSGVRINADLPIWYDKYNPHGRLIANREGNISKASVSMRQRRGSQFLSTRFPYIDEKGLQLKHEMTQLAHEVADGIIPVTPSPERSDKAVEYILGHVNHLSEAEFIKLKREATRSGESFPQLYLEYKRSRVDGNTE